MLRYASNSYDEDNIFVAMPYRYVVSEISSGMMIRAKLMSGTINPITTIVTYEIKCASSFSWHLRNNL